MNLPPGRALDALIGEKIMKWMLPKEAPVLKDYLMYYPPYSTDIAEAFGVVDKMISQEYNFALERSNKRWLAIFGRNAKYIGDDLYGPASMSGDTAPHAICLAALDAFKEADSGADLGS